MTEELTITRANLKKIAKLAMGRYKLTKEQKQRLTEAAETAPVVLSAGWRLGECGCLVGTAYPELFVKKSGEAKKAFREDLTLEGLWSTGIEFDDLLCSAIGRRGCNKAPVKVLD